MIIDAEGKRQVTDYEEVEVEKTVMKKVEKKVKRTITE